MIGTPFDLWGSRGGWYNQAVVGESHYLPALQRLLPHRGKWSEELETTALLIPEPSNRHDRSAVAVQIDGNTVGYLPRDIAPSYQPLLLGLANRHSVGRVPSRVWGGPFDYDGLGSPERFNASVTLALAEPHMCLPVNPPPARHMLLPRGAAIQVTGEERYMSAIVPLLRPEGECLAYAVLREQEDASGRPPKERVEVFIDGRRVGLLTPKMSNDVLPAVRHLRNAGYETAAMAKVKGNVLKAEVTLYCTRAHELPTEWLPSLAEQASPTDLDRPAEPPAMPQGPRHIAIPPKPTRIRFAAPPGWPAPPQAWEPPLGWQPDQSWPPAPSGWQYWVTE